MGVRPTCAYSKVVPLPDNLALLSPAVHASLGVVLSQREEFFVVTPQSLASNVAMAVLSSRPSAGEWAASDTRARPLIRLGLLIERSV